MIADPFALTIAMLAAFALTLGGILTIVKQRQRTRVMLMLVCALVLFGNVLIWVWH